MVANKRNPSRWRPESKSRKILSPSINILIDKTKSRRVRMDTFKSIEIRKQENIEIE